MKCGRARRRIHMAFLDISKAYDSEWREGLWHKMKQYEVEEKFVRHVKDYSLGWR